jgi:hypothetical protein
VAPQPATTVNRAAARANLRVGSGEVGNLEVGNVEVGSVEVRGAKTWATNRKGLRRGRDCVLAAGSILAKCKTSPTLLLVLTMLKA